MRDAYGSLSNQIEIRDINDLKKVDPWLKSEKTETGRYKLPAEVPDSGIVIVSKEKENLKEANEKIKKIINKAKEEGKLILDAKLKYRRTIAGGVQTKPIYSDKMEEMGAKDILHDVERIIVNNGKAKIEFEDGDEKKIEVSEILGDGADFKSELGRPKVLEPDESESFSCDYYTTNKALVCDEDLGGTR